MLKKYWRSLLEEIGLLAIIFTVISLILPDVFQLRFFYFLLCFTTPSHLFSFFTFQLKLFSNRLWIRRTIVMLFSAIILVLVSFMFGYLRFEFSSLIAWCIAMLIFLILSIFAYYVGDKIEQQNLNLINQKLADKNTRTIE